MAHFESHDGTVSYYEDQGQGPPVVFVHGFAADTDITWGRPGILDAVADKGYRILSMDLRGHGRSSPGRNPAMYTMERVVGDLVVLLDQVGLRQAHLVGYSLGSRVVMELSCRRPSRATSVTLAGIGAKSAAPKRIWGSEEIATALETDKPTEVHSPRARAFRAFAESTGADRSTLAAMQRALIDWPRPRPEEIAVPALVIAGVKDDLAGSPFELAERIPAGKAVEIRGNHMNAVLDPELPSHICQHVEAVENL
ncbi:MAG: alpha/beta hydrolase [Actinomycetota bacterium]|nr:alpha/beta hydrolase [Actinomycetota bacterium]